MNRKVFFKRILTMIPTLLGVSILLFVLLKRTPGDPVSVIVGPRAPQEVVDAYREKLHLNDPAVIQYFYYMKTLLRGDFGKSYYTNQDVFKDLMQKLPNTLLLATLSMVMGVLMGVFFGITAALFRGSFIDRLVSTVSVLFISTPVFWTAIMLVLVFSIMLQWVPASSMGGEGIIAFILPAFVLGSRSAGYIGRLTRSSMLDALSADYIRTARSKGVSRWGIVIKHALRNSLIPVVTLVGIDFASYLNGSVLTEKIFGIDGIGRYAINAIVKRDIPVIMGTVMLGAFIFIVINIIVDLLYFKLDPRISEKPTREAL